jgi:hypothetical protein
MCFRTLFLNWQCWPTAYFCWSKNFTTKGLSFPNPVWKRWSVYNQHLISQAVFALCTILIVCCKEFLYFSGLRYRLSWWMLYRHSFRLTHNLYSTWLNDEFKNDFSKRYMLYIIEMKSKWYMKQNLLTFVIESMSPCGGRLEYLHCSPVRHRRWQKGNLVPGGISGPPCLWGT